MCAIWYVNISKHNGWMLLGINPFSDPISTQFYVTKPQEIKQEMKEISTVILNAKKLKHGNIAIDSITSAMNAHHK